MEEVEHRISVLEAAKQALIEKNAFALRDLSNQTIHCASTHQDIGSIVTAVLIYSLSKLIERRDFVRIRNWDKLVYKLNDSFTSSIKALMENDEQKYNKFLQEAREILESFSIDMRHYVQEVIRKAAINKASKMYEHGISLGQTANLLGVTNWELSEYTGQGKMMEGKYNETISERNRVKIAMEFFE